MGINGVWGGINLGNEIIIKKQIHKQITSQYVPYPDQHGLSRLLIKFHLYHFSCVRSLLFCCMYVNGGLHASSWIGTGGHVPAAIV